MRRALKVCVLLALAACKPAGQSAVKEAVATPEADQPNVRTFDGKPLPVNQQAILDTMVQEFAKARGKPATVKADETPGARSENQDDLAESTIPMSENPGKWTAVYHTPDTQSIHTMLLPSGKVLLVNGSSHRTRGDGRNFFRSFEEVNNMAVVDLTKGKESFKKIKLPENELQKIRDEDKLSAIDLFCGGHNQLPNGDVLFIGGSRQYDNGNFSFSGNHIAWEFDAAEERFSKVMKTKEGRWYPGVFELGDGRMAVLSGIGDEPQSYGPSPDYALDVSYLVEVYDPYTGKWDSQSIKDMPVETASSKDRRFPEFIGGSWDGYPRAALQDDGSILFTGDGVYPGSRFNKNIFSIHFSPYGKPLKLDLEGFENKRTGAGLTSSYPGMAVDPRTNKGDILVFGGQLGMNNTGEAINSDTEVKRTTSDLTTIARQGRDVVTATYPKAYGDRPMPANPFRNRDGSMHNSAVVLPTQQVLVLGGGNYGFRAPVFFPSLFTPDAAQKSGFRVERLSSYWLPHLYHSAALLLPDARVMLAGGNVHRALALDPEPASSGDGAPVDTDFQLTESTHPYDLPGQSYSLRPRNVLGDETLAQQKLPAEMHFIEVFEPPYLTSGKPRPVITSLPDHHMTYGKPFRFQVDAAQARAQGAKVTIVKLGSITHGMDFSQKLVRLDLKGIDSGTALVDGPASGNVAPPGYYMMFFVSADGVPSVSKIVCLSRPEPAFAKACERDFNDKG